MLAGSDISGQNPTEFIAHYIEDTFPLFQQVSFERYALFQSWFSHSAVYIFVPLSAAVADVLHQDNNSQKVEVL